MIKNEDKLKQLLNTFNEEGILDKIIIIGSWCQYFYERYFPNFKAFFMTTDIDFYVPNTNKIIEKNSLIKSLKNINYDMFEDVLTNKSKFQSPDGFELEFLTSLKRNDVATIELGNTNIYAETLPYVDVFNTNYEIINYEGLLVKVATPASYVIQKLLINEKREIKSSKDLNSINHLLVFIKEDYTQLEELKSLYDSLPPKWKVKINSTCDKNNIKLFY